MTADWPPRGSGRGFRSQLTPTHWANLVQGGARKQFHTRDVLLRQGDYGGWVLLLLKGRLKVLYSGDEGGDLLLAVRGPGDVLGEFSTRDGGPRSATVAALESGVAYAVSRDRFLGYLDRHALIPALDHYVLGKVRESATLTWRTVHSPAAARLAALLLDILNAAGPDHTDPDTIPMTQEELAGALGLARSSIAPVLASWKNQGLITIARSRVRILDPERLLPKPG